MLICRVINSLNQKAEQGATEREASGTSGAVSVLSASSDALTKDARAGGSSKRQRGSK